MIDDDDEVVRHSMPKQKKIQTKRPHSLATCVERNHNIAKKH